MEVSDEMDRGMDISVHRGGICRAAPTQERILSCILWWKGTAKLGGDHAALLSLVLRTDVFSGHIYPCPSHHLQYLHI